MAPVRGIAALLKSLSKRGKGVGRKPLLGKGGGKDAVPGLDQALTTQADFDSLMRSGSRRDSRITHAPWNKEKWAANRARDPRAYTDEPPGLRRVGRRPSARERREERIAGVTRRPRGPLDDVNALESELSANQSSQIDTIRRMIEELQAGLGRNV